MTRSLLLGFLAIVTADTRGRGSEGRDECAQPSPQEMAKAAGVELPRLPWHGANIWWTLEGPVTNFRSLEVEVTVDRDVPSTYNLYVSPCGSAKINGLQFYGGLQTNINGWADKVSRQRVFRGKGAIFSRWSADKQTPIGLDHVETADSGCLVESAGYEGAFASVRRPFAWTKGTYRWSVTKERTEDIPGRPVTWFACRVTDSAGLVTEVGSLRFEGTDFTYGDRHSAFVEVYATQQIPRSHIPKVNVTFGWPRINGKPIQVKKVSAFYPHTTGPASPDCAVVRADGDRCVVAVGEIFRRDESQRSHPLRQNELLTGPRW